MPSRFEKMILRPINAIRQKRKGYAKLSMDPTPLFIPPRSYQRPPPPLPPKRRPRRQSGSGLTKKKKKKSTRQRARQSRRRGQWTKL